MNFIKSVLPAAALSVGLSFTAQAVNVGGVVWDPNSMFDFSSNSNLIEDQLDIAAGKNELYGFGIVTNLNGENGMSFCPGCELTYEFGGYTVKTVDTTDPDETVIAFTGGWINFYVDRGDDFTAYSAADSTTATNGNLWLSLTAHEVMDADYGLVTLVSELDSFGTGSDLGDGKGLLDVVGGLAMENFDTNTQDDGADWSFTSSFAPIPGGATPEGFELFGSADFAGMSIPEPSSVALLGLGMIGLSFGARRRKAK